MVNRSSILAFEFNKAGRPRNGDVALRLMPAKIAGSVSIDGFLSRVKDESLAVWFSEPHSDGQHAGLVKEIERREDGLWAQINWTASGTAALAAWLYRGARPVLIFKADGARITVTVSPSCEEGAT